jgi:DNA repair protein RadA/Sms
MTKTKVEFVCASCGATHYQWAGQCLECKEWNTLEEVFVTVKTLTNVEAFISALSKVNNTKSRKKDFFSIYQSTLKIISKYKKE